MAWSLLNAMLSEKVAALVDEGGTGYAPEVPRMMSRETALSVVHAALWAHSSRDGSDAGSYAMMNLFNALGLKGWTFDDDEQQALDAFRKAKYAAMAKERQP